MGAPPAMISVGRILSFLLLCSFLAAETAGIPSEVRQLLQHLPTLPRYVENGYSPLGRSPVVDVLLADPLYMAPYAEQVSTLIREKAYENNLAQLATSLFMAGGIPIQSEIATIKFLKPLNPFTNAFSENTARLLYSCWQAFLDIRREVFELFMVFSEEDKQWIKEHYDSFFFGDNPTAEAYDFFTTGSAYPLKFFALAARLDLARLADCARRLSKIVDELYREREELLKVSLTKDFLWEEEGAKFFISSASGMVHRTEADFFIDLGGKNTIHSAAGGTEGRRPLALHIDLRGNNSYIGKDFCQGSGFLGVGLLASFNGNNSYSAKAYSQACGFFGVGILANYGGYNRYILDFGGQSLALFGSSLLYDGGSNNDYVATQGMAQGASSTLGVAFLVNRGGDSIFTSGALGRGGSRYGGIGQGSSVGVRHDPWLGRPSLYGGLAFLYLGAGGNKLTSAWLGQGSGYFLGAGIAVAEGSGDHFRAKATSQGQGLHLAAGLLFNKGSHSTFEGGYGSLGVGADYAVGMYVGLKGSNTYVGAEQAAGTARKPKGLGIFISGRGLNRYSFERLSNADVLLPQSPKDWPWALFIQLGDSCYPNNVDRFSRGMGLTWGYPSHSLGLALPASSERFHALLSLFHRRPQAPFPFNPLKGWEGNRAYRPLPLADAQALADEIANADYDRRRQIYETLDLMRFYYGAKEPDLHALLLKPESLSEDAFNYAVFWALRHRNKADLTGIKNALSSKLFASPYAHKMATSLFATFWSASSTPLLKQIMLSAAPEESRYIAALALAINLKPDELAILQEGLASDSELVRYAIAKNLRDSDNSAVLPLMRGLFNDPSLYVRRAASLAALSMGDKGSIPILLETLKFNTLDIEEDFSDNPYHLLAQYTGVDYGSDLNAWLLWWHENGSSPSPSHKP